MTVVIISARPGWWKTATQEELSAFLSSQQSIATTPARLRQNPAHFHLRSHNLYSYPTALANLQPYEKWPGAQPELLDENSRILSIPGRGGVVVCSKGFAVDLVPVPGMIGLVDVGDLELNAARSEALE